MDLFRHRISKYYGKRKASLEWIIFDQFQWENVNLELQPHILLRQGQVSQKKYLLGKTTEIDFFLD